MTDTTSHPLSANNQSQARWRVPAPALAVAAILVIGLAGYVALRRDRAGQPPVSSPRMVATGVGTIDSLTLPDGTHVILGPLSSITIVKGYGTGRREVELRGDAFFDIAQRLSAPFTTRALGVTITDVGTSFAVRTDSSTGVSVTVRDGAVLLKPADTATASTVILGAGQYALLALNGQAATRPATEQDIAWMQRRVVFRESPMSEVIQAFRQWYGIELRLADPSLASRHLTATFSGETAETALEVIRLSLGADIERRGDTAIVR